MYLAYKYIKKRRRERAEAEAKEAASSAQPEALKVGPSAVDDGDKPGAAEPGAVVTATDIAAAKPPDAKDDEKPQVDLAEKKRMRNYRLKILFGLVLPFTLQGLDTTIIASALPFIATDFGAFTVLPLFLSLALVGSP